MSQGLDRCVDVVMFGAQVAVLVARVTVTRYERLEFPVDGGTSETLRSRVKVATTRSTLALLPTGFHAARDRLDLVQSSPNWRVAVLAHIAGVIADRVAASGSLDHLVGATSNKGGIR